MKFIIIKPDLVFREAIHIFNEVPAHIKDIAPFLFEFHEAKNYKAQ
jgi:hypothetical protein